MREFVPKGVMPACLMPADADGNPDDADYRAHLCALAEIRGLAAIVVNGHAAEVHALSETQQEKGIALACSEVGDRVSVVAGIYCETASSARRVARRAGEDGAAALLLFPPNSLMFGGNGDPRLGTSYIEEIADATDLPLIVFQYPVTTALWYQLDTLVRLCERVERIVAVKDLCSDPRLHERTILALHSLSRPVNVLTSHSQWLGGSLAMGARGIISGAGSVIADRQRRLFDVFSSSADQRTKQSHLDEMSLLVEAFYGAPYVSWQARMKAALFHFGRIKTQKVFSPLKEISENDLGRMLRLLAQANLTRENLYSA